MTEKLKLSRTGKIAALLTVIFTGTGAGYYVGTGAPDPFDQLVSGLQSAAEQKIAESAERARQTAFVKNTCDTIDDALNKVFGAAGVERDFSTIYDPPIDRHGSCAIVLHGETLYEFYDSEDFSPDSRAARLGIPLLMDRATKGMSTHQLTRLQETLPTFLKDLAP